MLDEQEFLSEFGLRSLSHFHADHPYVFQVGGQEYRVDYLPAESNRHVRRQLQLARSDLDAGQCLIVRALVQLLPLLRQ